MTITDIINDIKAGSNADKISLAAELSLIADLLTDDIQTKQVATLNAGKAIAQPWYDANVLPSLTWRATQDTKTQISNLFADRDHLYTLKESDQYRVIIIKENIKTMTNLISTLKNGP